MIGCQRQFQIADRLDLDVPKPGGDQFRHPAQIAAELRFERCQADQFFRPMEREYLAAAGVRIEQVGKLRDAARRFVGKRQRQMDNAAARRAGRQNTWPTAVSTPVSVWPFGLGFDRAQSLGVGVEKIVGEAGFQRELTHRHAAGRGNIHLVGRLHRPASLLKLVVDFFAGFLFGRHGRDTRFSALARRGRDARIPGMRMTSPRGRMPSQESSLVPKSRVRNEPKGLVGNPPLVCHRIRRLDRLCGPPSDISAFSTVLPAEEVGAQPSLRIFGNGRQAGRFVPPGAYCI